MPIRTPDSKSPIGVFDSGIGGLTVVKEIRRKLPDESIIYFGDTARVPYGTKSRETILKFATEDVEFLMSHGVKMIVSACFSVSSNALPDLKEKFDIPIIGMIEPGVNAVIKNSCKKIGVIGTRATIESGAFKKELEKRIKDLDIYSKACPLFVPLAEEGWIRGKVPEIVASKYLKSLKERHIGALILGCTHYPLLYETIEKVIGGDVEIIQPGQEAATLIENILRKRNLNSSAGGDLSIYLSDRPRDFRNLASNFLGESPGEIHIVRNSF